LVQDPALELTAFPHRPLAVFKGSTSKGREGTRGLGKSEMKGRVEEVKGDFAHPKVVASRSRMLLDMPRRDRDLG